VVLGVIEGEVVVKKDGRTVAVWQEVLVLQLTGNLEAYLCLVEYILEELEVSQVTVELTEYFHVGVGLNCLVGLVHLHLGLLYLPLLG